jgi:type I restriction enzyme S subunit
MSFEIPTLRIGDFADVKGGKRMPAGTALTSKKTSHPYLRIVDFKDGAIDASDLLYVPESVFPQISRYVISSEDIYISIVGTVGLVGSVPISLNGANLTENAAKICSIDSAKVNSRYLTYYLRSEAGQRAINSLTVGSTQPKLALFRIEQIEIPVPSLNVQHEIAATLGALDDRITLLRETNATLEAIAQALFKSWFVDFDPVRAKMEGRVPEGMDEATAALFPDSLEETELGMVPTGWGVGTLADVATLNAQSLSTRNPPTEINYIDLTGVKANVFDVPQCYSFADAPSRARRILREGDCIVGTVRPGNRSFGFIATAQNNLTGSTGFAVLSPQQHWMAAYTYLCATRDESIGRLAALADGGAYPAVRPDVVASTPCIKPQDEVMKLFDSVARPLLDAISANSEQAQTLSTLRDTLLPRLISGQLRVAEAQTAVEKNFA